MRTAFSSAAIRETRPGGAPVTTTVEAQPAQLEQPAQAAPQEDPVAKLKQMKELLDAGVVSQEEFDTLKKRLLGL